MKTRPHPHLRRSLSYAAVGILAVALTSCTGRGGGQLPPDAVFNGAASFGFSFSCEDKSSLTGPPGRLRIQLSYTEHGSNPFGSSFSIHGTVDNVDRVVESMFCIGDDPPEPDPNQLIFLGRYRVTSSAPSDSAVKCAETRPSCRFEVIVRDNDMGRGPSQGDTFSIKLAGPTGPITLPVVDDVDLGGSQLDPASVVYSRDGKLSSGNLTVD